LEKNLPFLLEAFKELRQLRSDVALVIVGDGPYRPLMENAAAGLPVHFLGVRGDDTRPTLATIYASADLFVFPSETDTLGQVVIEAQAAGLPVLVSNSGGPKETIDDGLTGQVVLTNDPVEWTKAIDQLLDDTPRRLRMGRTATTRIGRFGLGKMFAAFWDEHFKAVRACELAATADASPVSVP
jgi:glycosyltransferase involved in cell wall biosynthesis